MPRRKRDLLHEIARLTQQMNRQREHVEALRREQDALRERHEVDLIAMRYRTLGEGLLGQIVSRADDVIAEGLPEISVVVEADAQRDDVAEALRAQVVDLQQRLTDAQRTIEMLVARVLEMVADLDRAEEERGSRLNHPSSWPVQSTGDAQVRTLRLPLSRETS
jgi:DNA repair exonuclease SbcCD ATPase subunit